MRQARFYYFFNNKEHFRRFLYGLAFLAFFTGLGALFVSQSLADVTAPFSCSGGTASGNLFDQDTIGTQVTDQNGNPTTLTITSVNDAAQVFGSVCPNTLGIFGQIICFFKSAIGQIVSSMYCGFQNTLAGPLSIAIELFIVVTGIAIVTGITNLTVREGMIALLKIALVWAFATNATWGIGIAYNFFMGLAEQGSIIVLGAVSGSGGSGAAPGTYLTQPDSIIQGIFGLISAGSGGGSFMPANVPSTCMIWIVGFLLLLLIFMPWVAMLIIGLIVQYLWLYARALLGYLTALVLIGFLFILAPLFISFALFKVTRPMFESWLQYLVSFSLQMVIVFGFLAMLSMIPLGAFFSEIVGLLREYNTTGKAFFMPIPVHFCSICTYTVNATNIWDATPPVTCDGTGNVIELSQLIADKKLVPIIASQVAALWIVGNIMQDFLKRAPAIARDLTGGLPFATTLGGQGAGAAAGSASIEYLGMDELEQAAQNLQDKVMSGDPDSGLSGWASKLAPAVLAGGILASIRKNNPQALGEHPDDATGATSSSSRKKPAGNAMLNPTVSMGSGLPLAASTVMRPPLVSAQNTIRSDANTQNTQAGNTSGSGASSSDEGKDK